MNLRTGTRELIYSVFGSPDRDRLASEIAQTWTDLDYELHAAGSDGVTPPWARAAYRFLLQAENCLATWDIQQAWTALLSAKRAMLSGFRDQNKIERVAIALRREANKLSGWRAKAIEDLICGKDGKVLADVSSEALRMRVIDALVIRDDQYHTTAFKILLRRRHLFHLFLILWISIALCLLLSFFGLLPFAGTKQVAIVILFGVLGAAVSVGQSLLSADISAKIPAQQIGSFVIWMRPGIGAVAALVALVLLHANKSFHLIGYLDSTNLPVVIAVAFAAGFSERFIVGAIERIAQTPAKADSA